MRVFVDRLGSHHGPTPGVEHNGTEPGYFGTHNLLRIPDQLLHSKWLLHIQVNEDFSVIVRSIKYSYLNKT